MQSAHIDHFYRYLRDTVKLSTNMKFKLKCWKNSVLRAMMAIKLLTRCSLWNTNCVDTIFSFGWNLIIGTFQIF